MTGLRPALIGRLRPLWAAVVLALALAGSQALAQNTVPSGFDAIPRPPGTVGTQGFVPPGGPAAIAPSGPAMQQQPTVANPNPLQLTPPAAQPASLPPP